VVKAAIYTRISSDPTRERLGVQRQEAECRALCASRRWTVGAVFEDDDRSAYSGKSRPQYDALLDAVRAGEIGAVVAWHPDRLHRSPRELEDFIDLIEVHGIKVATVQAGEYDLATPAGRMAARIVGAVARGESEHKSARAKLKARELAVAGKGSGGGTRPFGYEPDRRTIRLSEAKLIREAVARFLAGDTIRSITADWNRRGIETVTGGRWHSGTLRRLIGSARIAGWREHLGTLTAEAEWSPIITLDDHHAVRAILADPDRLKRRTSRRYLLTGFLFCSLCGAKLVARPTVDKRKKYVCSAGVNFHGCGKLSCIAAPLDDLVTAAVLETLRNVDLAELLSPPMPDTTRAEVSDIEARLDELAEMFAAGDIGRREWLTAREALDARLASLRAAETAGVGRHASLADAKALRSTAATWDTLGITRQRAVLELLIDRVVLSPAVAGRNFFDPDRVEIHWR
jgi:site-specific DNA recombinase